MEVDDELEVTLVTIRKVFLFQIPPRSSSEGYRAKEWPTDAFWTGRLRMVSQGNLCTVRLEHADKAGLFAACPVYVNHPKMGTTVESVVDSSRYFVLRLDDGKGNRVFVGLGFGNREEAFDFKVAMQEHDKQIEAEKTVSSKGAEQDMDFSLKGPITLGKSLDGNVKKKGDSISGSSDLLGLSPPAVTSKEKLKKKKKKQKETDHDDESQGTSQANGGAGSDWATFD